GVRTYADVPLLRGAEAIGVLSVYARAPDALTEQHRKLLETFADQAVIAIENARLFAELQERNAQLTDRTARLSEALEHQTATAEVLQAISCSPPDARAVLGTVVATTARLCGSDTAGVWLRREDGKLVGAALHGDWGRAARPGLAVEVDRGTATGTAI